MMAGFQNGSPHHGENPYSAPATSSAPEHTDLGDEAHVAELRALVGRKAPWYLSRWQSPQGMGMNWPAFLFSGFWLAYRKLYRAAVLFFGGMLALSVLEEVLFVHLLGLEGTPRPIDLGISLAIALSCGLLANRWYLAHARNVIADVRARGYEGDGLLKELTRRGGTSFGAAAALFGAFILASMVVFLGLEFMAEVLAD